MPRFYFHVHDGCDILDKDGTELRDVDEARVEAIRYAGVLISQQFCKLPAGEDWNLEVTDATGLVLFRLDFTIAEAPVVKAMRRV